MRQTIVQVDAFTSTAVRGQSRGGLRPRRARRRRLDAGRRPRDEPVGDGLRAPPSRRRATSSAGSRRPSRSISAATRRSPAAHVLWEEGHSAAATRPPGSRPGAALLTAERRTATGSSSTSRPSPRSRHRPARRPRRGARRGGRSAGRNRFDWLIEVDSETAVRRLGPDFTRLRGGPDPRRDRDQPRPNRPASTSSRASSPRGSGVPERSGLRLGPLLPGALLEPRLGRTELVGYQASPRGGVVRVRHQGRPGRARRSGGHGS